MFINFNGPFKNPLITISFEGKQIRKKIKSNSKVSCNGIKRAKSTMTKSCKKN